MKMAAKSQPIGLAIRMAATVWASGQMAIPIVFTPGYEEKILYNLETGLAPVRGNCPTHADERGRIETNNLTNKDMATIFKIIRGGKKMECIVWAGEPGTRTGFVAVDGRDVEYQLLVPKKNIEAWKKSLAEQYGDVVS